MGTVLILMKDEIKAAIEAVLFASGGKFSASSLAILLQLEEAEVEPILEEMLLDYAAMNRGIQLICDESGYYLCTKPHFSEIMGQAVKPAARRLSNAAMETLAIVAYRQPVTKIDIEGIRGVKSDHIIGRLLEQDLIAEVGYARMPGKPVLYGTSHEFLKVFGIASLDDLPDIDLLNGQGDTSHGQKAID